MYQQHRLTVPVTAIAADQVQHWLSLHCATYQLSSRQSFQLCLGVVEAVNNLWQHSPPEARDQQFHIHVLFTLNRVEIEIVHRAPPFRIPEQQTPAALDDALLQESGRGWLILKQWFTEVDYQVEAGVNRLRLQLRTAACAFDHHYPQTY